MRTQALRAICRRDFLQYLATPTGWVLLGLVTFMHGLFFAVSALNLFSNMAAILTLMQGALFVIAPLLTMRAFADEIKQGTDRLLWTAPLATWEVVLAKYLSALLFFALLSLTTLIPLLLTLLLGGRLDLAALAAYVAFFALGAAYLAISLWVASMTENAVLAATVSMLLLLALQLMDTFAVLLGNAVYSLLRSVDFLNLLSPARELQIGKALASALIWLSPSARVAGFSQAYFSLDALLYLFSLSALCLRLCVHRLEGRRWSGK